ncbi:MAG TPA: HD domain-containing protein [Candidatus Paceibacterota bacterium]|nr:HD domain-containing protein [Candidatus Paceibacterota bacterium]
MNSVTKMRTLVTRLHRGRERQDGTPDSVHVKRVAAILTAALKEAGETPPPKKLATLQCAALGHDLLEDTKATPEEIVRIAGEEALALIEQLTNRWGDDHPAPYVRQVRNAPEEARLVKLADLCDNLSQASMNAAGLGSAWMKGYFLPIVDPSRKAVSSTHFSKYPKTARILITSAALARAHLTESLANLRGKNWLGAKV